MNISICFLQFLVLRCPQGCYSVMEDCGSTVAPGKSNLSTCVSYPSLSLAPDLF